jgi:8-oxo-dGTP pyrophosphatase MutT (NUDIX family)
MIPGVDYPQEIVRRRKRNYLANKVLPVIVSETLADQFIRYDHTLEALIKILRAHRERYTTVFLHQKRPITYLPWPDDGTKTELKFNVQVELPGGIMEAGELSKISASRELMEETGLTRVVASAPLIPGYICNDAGTHQERYGFWLAICTGEPKPNDAQREEGIVRADVVPLPNATTYLISKIKEGYPVEWATLLGHSYLQSLLR